MVQRDRRGFVAGALVSLVFPGLAGCAGPPYGGPPPPSYPPYYFDYYYYPHADVYFHVYTGYYWYFDGRGWHRVRRLPRDIYLFPQYRVLLRIPDERPYRYHDEHRRRYPPPPSPPRTEAGAPPPRAGPGLPSPAPPTRQREEWERRDREEREHNLRRSEEYRKKRWVPPR